MTFRVSPGVYPRIIDLSFQPSYTNPSIACSVGGALRGPLGPNLVTDYQNQTAQYGLPNPTWGFMLDSSAAFLLQGTNIFLNRVVSSDAMYGMGLIANNWAGGIGGIPMGTSYTTIPFGSNVNYTDVNLDIQDIEFNGPLVATNSVTVTINTIASAAVAFINNNNDTMVAIQQAILNVLDGIGSGGYCDLPVTGSNYNILRIISPNALNMVITVNVTGTSPPTYRLYESDWLCIPVAQNPGSWSCPNNTSGTSGVAVGISNVDKGTAQRVTVSLSSILLTGQTLSMTVNGEVISTAFITSNNATLTAFCSAFNAYFGSVTAGVISSGGVNNLQFVLVAPDSTTPLIVTLAEVTGAGTLPIVSFTTTLNAVPSTGSFNLVVYENSYFTNPDEIYLCTYGTGTDGLGNPTQLDYVINGIPGVTAAASPRINVVVNQNFSGQVNAPTNVTLSTNTLGLPNERWLGGGADGSIPSTQQVVAGWTQFNNPEQITISIMINSGYTDPAVHQEMVSIASTRMDCFAILDMPSGSQDVNDAVNFRMNVMDIDSFWGAIYTPDILIYDDNMGLRRYIPPSGILGGVYAYTDAVAAAWYSPAGLNRGILNQALGARFTYEEGDRDALSQVQINAIRKYGSAWVVWGEYTLQSAMSALQSVAVVRLMIVVMTSAASACAYSVFEPNNPFTWNNITVTLTALLQPIEDGQGITDFLVQCNSSNNTPDIIDERVCLVALWIKPTLSILYIRLDGIVTRQSAVFSVEETLTGNQF
jgi:phage tail sheath protein FI